MPVRHPSRTASPRHPRLLSHSQRGPRPLRVWDAGPSEGNQRKRWLVDGVKILGLPSMTFRYLRVKRKVFVQKEPQPEGGRGSGRNGIWAGWGGTPLWRPGAWETRSMLIKGNPGADTCWLCGLE